MDTAPYQALIAGLFDSFADEHEASARSLPSGHFMVETYLSMAADRRERAQRFWEVAYAAGYREAEPNSSSESHRAQEFPEVGVLVLAPETARETPEPAPEDRHWFWGLAD